MRPVSPNRFGSIVAPALLVVAAAVAACSTGAAPTQAPAASGNSAVLAAGRAAPTAGPVSNGGSGGNAAIGSGNACALLTQNEVNAAMGTTMAPGAPVVASVPNVCGWTQPGDASFTGRKVLVSIITPLVYTAGEQMQIEGITRKPVSGLGDAAYETYSENMPFELRVEKGGKALAIGIYSGGAWDTAKSESVAKAIALDALARL